MGLKSRHKSSPKLSARAVFNAASRSFTHKQSAAMSPIDKTAPRMKLVSRAGYKLLYAVEVFDYDFKDKIVLDIGSSTGGFTEVCLTKGAKYVIAIELGTRQMHPLIRSSEKVELHEKTDFFNTKNDDKIKIDTVVADVSFVSLTKILRHAIMANWATFDTDFLVMLKPQFEARQEELVNGVIKNSKIRRKIIANFEYWLKKNGFMIKFRQDNVLSGKNGNIEKFYWLKYLRKNK